VPEIVRREGDIQGLQQAERQARSDPFIRRHDLGWPVPIGNASSAVIASPKRHGADTRAVRATDGTPRE
jgi:hypothetical protein